jgi:preprotein translocase subunit YajC
MFKRIFHEEWTTVVPIIAFVLTFTFFVVMMVRAARMKKAKREHMASLPLDDDSSR